MQEFSSINVSSYEAGTLADRLTEQAGDGWSVVAIVPTGSTVTAYLSREASASSPSTSDSAAGATTMLTHDAEDADDAAAGESWSSDEAGDDGVVHDALGDVGGGDGADTAASADDATSEAPGWAVGEASSTAAETSSTHVTPTPAASHEASAASSTSSVAEAMPSDGGSEAAAGDSAAATAAGAAPAGWYADPSSRFELRYWDGGQWTEHVSRAGQQYTDPPVA